MTPVLQDADYEASGAKIVDTKDAFGQDIVLKVRPPKIDPEAGQFKEGARCLTPCFHAPMRFTPEDVTRAFTQAAQHVSIIQHLATGCTQSHA